MREKTTQPKNIAIIGAGPAGLTAAYLLQQNGHHCSLYEAQDYVGGMSRTFELWNQNVDLGPHRFFSLNPEVNRLWSEIAGNDFHLVNRRSRILYNGKFFHYPLKVSDVLLKLGPWEAFRSVASFFRTRGMAHSEQSNFENWIVANFGRRLFEIFFKSYSEKLWGLPCQEIDSDFAAQRIRKLDLREVIVSALGIGSSSKHKSLIDQFAYPNDGTGVIYERMAKRFEDAGGKLFLNTAVNGFECVEKAVSAVRTNENVSRPADVVISSMPLTLLVEKLPQTPAGILSAAKTLRFRNTILVYLLVEGSNLFADNWLYIHSPHLKVGRVTNFRTWSPFLAKGQPHSIISLEYWCNHEDDIWKASEEDLIELASRELRETKLIGTSDIFRGAVIRVPRCYPVYRTGYQNTLDPIADYLNSISNLIPIGRYGSFKYNNQDHSIHMGMLAAKIVNNDLRGKEALWSVNSDFDSYQEDGAVTLFPAS